MDSIFSFIIVYMFLRGWLNFYLRHKFYIKEDALEEFKNLSSDISGFNFFIISFKIFFDFFFLNLNKLASFKESSFHSNNINSYKKKYKRLDKLFLLLALIITIVRYFDLNSL